MIQTAFQGVLALIMKLMNFVSQLIRPMRRVQALRWDQIIWMAVVGLAIWVLIQNDNNAKTLATTVITTVQTTLQNMLTGSY